MDDLDAYRLIVGKNQKYYLFLFEQYDGRGGGAAFGWNWGAFFGGGLWALYRKMYGWFMIFLAATVLVVIFGKGENRDAVNSFYIGCWITFSVFANYFYYQDCRRKIAFARYSVKTEARLRELLAYRGGVNRWVWWGLASLVALGWVAAAVIPAYARSSAKSDLREALAFADQVTAAVSRYAYDHRLPNTSCNSFDADFFRGRCIYDFPDKLEQIWFDPDVKLPKTIRSLSLDYFDSTEGQWGYQSYRLWGVAFRLTGGLLEGGELRMLPNVDSDGVISWKCRAIGVESKLLPLRCSSIN